MLLKILLVLTLILISREHSSYLNSYSIDLQNYPNNLIYGRIACERYFTRCVVGGVFMLYNQTTQKFAVASQNLCYQSQISKDGKLHICRTTPFQFGQPNTYTVIENPELGFISVQTFTSASNATLSYDGQWLVDMKTATNQLELFKWNNLTKIFQTSQNITVQGPINSVVFSVTFSANSEYLICNQYVSLDFYSNQGGIFVFKHSLMAQDVSYYSYISDIIVSQDGNSILISSDCCVSILDYSIKDQPITVYKKIIEGVDYLVQTSASRNLDTLVVLKQKDTSFLLCKIQENNYVLKNNVPGLPYSYSIYLNYDANWLIRPINNGKSMAFFILCQISGCTKCSTPNICSECSANSNLLITLKNGVNSTSCRCISGYTMSQTLNYCVECNIQNCMRCDQKNQCVVMDFSKFTPLEIILLILVIFLIIAIITFVIIGKIKLDRVNLLHPISIKEIPSQKKFSQIKLQSQSLSNDAFNRQIHRTNTKEVHIQSMQIQ